MRHIGLVVYQLIPCGPYHNIKLSSSPTLFITECVLCYIDTAASEALLQALAGTFPTAVFANYEMVQRL